MRSVRLRALPQAAVDEALAPFEAELAAAFRAVELGAVEALRSAAADGLTPEAAISRAADCMFGALPRGGGPSGQVG